VSGASTGLYAHELLSEATDLPRHEAERLLMAAAAWDRSKLAVGGVVEPAAAAEFRATVGRRRHGEPLQYIEGTAQFGPLELLVDDRALIPRPETEQLWELVVARFPTAPDLVVDLCTGSGNLALACKHAWPDAAVFATDSSSDAASLARLNAVRLGLDVTVLTGDLYQPLPHHLQHRVDVIVANPPYLAAAELATLAVEVRVHEPVAALVAGPRGDEVMTRIAAEAAQWLRPGGTIAVEISEFRAADAAALFEGFDAEIVNDLAGKPRFVVGAMGHGLEA